MGVGLVVQGEFRAWARVHGALRLCTLPPAEWYAILFWAGQHRVLIWSTLRAARTAFANATVRRMVVGTDFACTCCVHRMAAQRGFTLVELLGVFAVVAIVIAVATLDWAPARQRLALRTAARQVMLDLTAVRLRAAASNRNQRIVFPAGSPVYLRQEREGVAYVTVGGATALPREVTIASCNAVAQAITFRPRGNAATFGTVVLRNGLGEEKRVVVDIAGRIRLQ